MHSKRVPILNFCKLINSIHIKEFLLGKKQKSVKLVDFMNHQNKLQIGYKRMISSRAILLHSHFLF